MKDNNFKQHFFYLKLVHVILFFFIKKYRVKANISDEIKNLDEPFLLLSNHVGSYDPFLVGHFLRKKPHFVSSDAVMRIPLIGFFFRKLGVIPKQKNRKDSQVIRDMVQVVKGGGAIGLFPEGARTWTGTSLHFDPVIAKLVKLLKIPVVTATMKGMQLTHPRWGKKMRRGRIEIDYDLAFSKTDIATASIATIYQKIKENLYHDEVDWQRLTKHKIESNYRAEFIEHVLFLCESCQSIGKIESSGNYFECQKCKRKTLVNDLGFFQSVGGKAQQFDNIRDYYEWQRVTFETFIHKHFKNKTFAPLFKDQAVFIYKEVDNEMKQIGKGALIFYINRIIFSFGEGNILEFPINEIEVLNPQFKERIEMTYQGLNYRFDGEKSGLSGLKWEIATSKIWHLTGEKIKVSSYLKAH